MNMRSNKLKNGLSRAPHRALLKSLSLTDEEIQRPLIGIVNSANEIIPGFAVSFSSSLITDLFIPRARSEK